MMVDANGFDAMDLGVDVPPERFAQSVKENRAKICLDQQAAMEAAISILMAALEGANLVHDIGYLGQGFKES